MIKLTILTGPDVGSVLTPQGDTIVFGRSHTCDVVLRDEAVGRRHCTIERQDGGFVLTDLHSANGTFLNALHDRIEKRELKNGDEIILGKSRLRVEIVGEGTEETIVARPALETRDVREPQQASRTSSSSSAGVAAAQDSLSAIRQADVPIVLTVVKGPDRGQVYSPSEDVISIGKGETCTVVLHDSAVSRVHASIKREGGQYRLYDENSKNGTFLRTLDNRIRQTDLAEGDVIYVGSSQLLVDLHLQEKPAEVNTEGLTLISGKIGEKEFTFTLALPIRSARSFQDEEVPQDVEGDSPSEFREERMQVAPVPVRPQPRIALRVIEGPDSGTVFEPAPGASSFTVGRGKAADFRLQDQGASRIHFSVEATSTGFALVDVGSLNGTFIDQGTEKVSRVELKGGEQVRFSATCMQVEIIIS